MKKLILSLSLVVGLSSLGFCLGLDYGGDGGGGSTSASGSGTVGPGTSGTLSKFTSATTIGDSNITDNGSTVTIAVPLVMGGTGGNITPTGSSMTVAVAGTSYVQYASSYTFGSATIANAVIPSSMNIVNAIRYADFSAIDYVANSTNNVVNLTTTSFLFGNATFSNSVSSEAFNCVGYRWAVPEDLDTSVTMTVSRWKFSLGNTDTNTHRYFIAYTQTADSAVPPAGNTLGSITGLLPIALDFAGDASGASGDIETVSNVSLTGWAAALTAGRNIVISVCRDGNDAADASTVDSTSVFLRLSMGSTQ